MVILWYAFINSNGLKPIVVLHQMILPLIIYHNTTICFVLTAD